MLYIITPVFKRLPQTLAFYESLVQYIPVDFHLIIGDDDAPTFEHLTAFKQNPTVTVLKGNSQLFWGGTINLCLEYLHKKVQPKEEDIIVLANNDITINASTFEVIKGCLEKNKQAIYHPRVLNLHQEVIQSGAMLKSWAPIRCNYPLTFKEPLIKVDFITGRFLALHYNVLKTVGNIASNLPHYAGDHDYSYRAKRLGISTYLVRDAICYVDESTSGIKLHKKMSFKSYWNALQDIRSPLNIKYKYQLISNHNSWMFSNFAIILEFLKSFYKFLQAKTN